MRISLVCVVVLIASGCGRSNVAAVSGTVTMDNKPLPNATVVFEPTAAKGNPGPGSIGTTDANGRFTLQLMTKDVKGAVIGKHKVVITAYEGGGEIPSSAPDAVFKKALVPTKYNAESILTFEVPAAGTTQADFALKSK